MGFRFRLESVLKHRKRLEEMAQKEYAEAQRAVDAVLNELDAMYRRLDEVREEILEAQRVGTPENLHRIREMEAFMEGQKIRIQNTRMKARELLSIAEEKQEALIERAREHKMLTILRDKRLAEYRERLRLQELREIDEQVMMRANWGIHEKR